MIIGEAAVHVPEDICLRHPEVPWYDMRGMRNFVVHEYFRADDSIIWDTVQVDLPPLPDLLNKIIEENLEQLHLTFLLIRTQYRGSGKNVK